MAKETALELDSALTPPSQAPAWRKRLRMARAHPLGVFGLVCILLVTFGAIFAYCLVLDHPGA